MFKMFKLFYVFYVNFEFYPSVNLISKKFFYDLSGQVLCTPN